MNQLKSHDLAPERLAGERPTSDPLAVGATSDNWAGMATRRWAAGPGVVWVCPQREGVKEDDEQLNHVYICVCGDCFKIYKKKMV